jgi:hypothetical protein
MIRVSVSPPSETFICWYGTIFLMIHLMLSQLASARDPGLFPSVVVRSRAHPNHGSPLARTSKPCRGKLYFQRSVVVSFRASLIRSSCF